MKNYFKYAFLGMAMLGLVVTTGCSEEQSSININDVTTTTTIMGGVVAEVYIDDWVDVPVAGRTVFVGVPNSTFRDGASGYTWHTTTILADGTFNISVPFINDGEVLIYAEAFTTTVSGEQILFSTNRTSIWVEEGNIRTWSIFYDVDFLF